MWTYYLETVRIGFLQDFIQEWQAPNFHALYTHPFIWLLLVTVGAIGISRRRVDGADLALLTMFTYASLLAGRNFGPFALLVAPVLSRHVARILSRWGWVLRPQARTGSRRRLLLGAVNWCVVLLLVALTVVKIQQPISAEFNEQKQREELPVDAAAWIKANRPPGEMFNPYNWGGYLIWSLYPEGYRVYVDGRTDLYGDAFLREYVNVQWGRPGFEQVMDKHGINLILTQPDDLLDLQLACAGGWEQVYRDDVAVIWVREE